MKVDCEKLGRSCRIHCTVIVILIPLICLSIIIIPLACLIYLYRFGLFKLSSYLRPSLGKMLSTRSALLATDWPYDQPLFNITFKISFKNPVSLKQVGELLDSKWIQARNKASELKYPELQEFVTKWMGFTFWKSEKDFSVWKHMSEVEFDREEELQQLVDELVLKPFKKGCSPWEVILVKVRDASGDGRVLTILRWHHCMWDGFATMKLFAELSDSFDVIERQESLSRAENFNEYKKQQYASFWKTVVFILRAPYDIIHANVDSYDPIKSNSWHLPQKDLRRVWKTARAEKYIDIKLVREVKGKFGVSFTSVLTAGMTAATRNLMLKNSHRKIPNFINAGFPLPLPRNSDKLRNFWALTTMKIPVGEEDPLERLLTIEKALQRLKRSTMPAMSILLLPFLGGLFTWMLKLIFSNRYTSMIISIMPGPTAELTDSSGTMTAEQMEFYISLARGNTGLGISALTYNDKIRICVTVDLGIEEHAEFVQALADDVEKEINQLLSLPTLAHV